MKMEEINDEEEAKKLSVKEFLKCEMRIPSHVVGDLLSNIEKIWSPDIDNWDRLYVQFTDDKSVKICFSYAKNMRNKDSQIMQYFSPEFRDQCRTLNTVAFQLRNPTTTDGIKFKTRIKHGRTGLELEKRHPGQKPWEKVFVPNLPPIDLNPAPPAAISTSPPTVRERNNKRIRSNGDSSPLRESSSKTSKIEVTAAVYSEVTAGEKDKQSTSSTFKTLVDKFATK